MLRDVADENDTNKRRQKGKKVVTALESEEDQGHGGRGPASMPGHEPARHFSRQARAFPGSGSSRLGLVPRRTRKLRHLRARASHPLVARDQ